MRRAIVTALAARRRHPLAGVVLLLAGPARSPASLYAACRPAAGAAPPSDPRRRSPDGPAALPRELRHLPRPQRRRAATTRRRLVGVGAAAVDFQVGTGRMPSQADRRRRPRRSRSSSRQEEINAARRLRRLARPRPGHPVGRRGRPGQRRRPRDGGAIFRTNCAMCHNFAGTGGALTRGKYAPNARRDDPDAHLRGHAHRPAVDAGLQRRRPSPRRTSATSSPTSRPSQTQPSPGGFSLGSLGPVTEGLVRLDLRPRPRSSAARSGSGSKSS